MQTYSSVCFEPSRYISTIRDTIVPRHPKMSGTDHTKKPISIQSNHESHAQESVALFKQACSVIIYSLPEKYPDGIQLDGTWRPIHHKSCTSINPTDNSQDLFKATLYGKRSSHGGQSTRGGFRDPTSPTTARIQVPIPNPSMTTLLSYVEKCMETQIEAGATRSCIQTKRFQVDTHLTVYFEWEKEVGESGAGST